MVLLSGKIHFPLTHERSTASRFSVITFRIALGDALSCRSYGKRSAPPPPPSNPPPALQVMETSEESATESDAPIARPFQVPRPRSRSSAFVSVLKVPFYFILF